MAIVKSGKYILVTTGYYEDRRTVGVYKILKDFNLSNKHEDFMGRSAESAESFMIELEDQGFVKQIEAEEIWLEDE